MTRKRRLHEGFAVMVSEGVVNRWIAERGGHSAALDLIRRFEAGEKFDVT